MSILTVTVTQEVYLYLDKVEGKTTNDELRAQFPKVKSNTLSQIWKRWKNGKTCRTNQTKNPVTIVTEVTPGPAAPKKPTPNLDDITEETYKEYLLRVINNCETDIRICTEIRNYLDKKNILKPSSNDLPVDIDVDHLSQEYRKFKGDLIFGS